MVIQQIQGGYTVWERKSVVFYHESTGKKTNQDANEPWLPQVPWGSAAKALDTQKPTHGRGMMLIDNMWWYAIKQMMICDP